MAGFPGLRVRLWESRDWGIDLLEPARMRVSAARGIAALFRGTPVPGGGAAVNQIVGLRMR